MPDLLAPVGAGSGQPVVPVGPDGFTRAGQPPAAPAQPATQASLPAEAAPFEPAAAAPHAAGPPPPPRRDPVGRPEDAAPAGAVDGPSVHEALPGGADADAGSIYQSVAKYAAFCAACAEFPERLAETLAGYGIRDAAERAAVDQAWQDRFDDEPDAMTKWEELFAHFRGSLRKHR